MRARYCALPEREDGAGGGSGGAGMAVASTAAAAPWQAAGGAGVRGIQAGIDAGQHALGNRAFLRWVGELQSGRQDAAAADMAAPLQLMGKKKKKQPAAVEAGAEAQGTAAPGPAAAQPQASGTSPGMEPDGGVAGGGKKKKKKSRVQVALNTLRGEGIEAFAGYIDAEIGEEALLRTLVERITRAQDLQSVRAEALAGVQARLRLPDPLLPASAGTGLQPAGAGPEPEMAVIAPAEPELSLRKAVLFDACVKGDIKLFRRFFSHELIDVNWTCGQTTLLLNAACKGHAGIVGLLLRRPDINVNLAQPGGATPLFVAAQQGHVGVVEQLLDREDINVNLATATGATPLHIAAECGWAGVVKLLLDRPDINVNPLTVLNRTTPLCIAAQRGQEVVLKLLLAARGIGIDKQRIDGTTALFMAAQIGFSGIVKHLARCGADVNLAKDDGMTPLCVAALAGHSETVRILLQLPGIRVDLATANGTTPLGVAAQRGHKEIVRLLLRNGAGPNRANPRGITPLHVACLHGHTAIAQILLHAGADMDAEMTDLAGRSYTLCDIAELAGQREVMSVLAAQRRRREQAPSLPEQLPLTQEPGEPAPSPCLRGGLPGGKTDTSGRPAAGNDSASQAPVPPAKGVAAAMTPATVRGVSRSEVVPGSFPLASGPPSPLAQAQDALRQEVLGKLRADNLDTLQGIRLLEDINATDSIDTLCGLYNRLAHIERREERARRRKPRRETLRMAPGPVPAAADPAAAPVFALAGKTGLDADAVEVEIKQRLGRKYHRFVSQAVNDMEFGRGKPTSRYRGLWHVSAGIPGVGSCSVFYYLEGSGEKIRVVGIGRHVGRAAYELGYATAELGEAGRVLCIS